MSRAVVILAYTALVAVALLAVAGCTESLTAMI